MRKKNKTSQILTHNQAKGEIAKPSHRLMSG